MLFQAESKEPCHTCAWTEVNPKPPCEQDVVNKICELEDCKGVVRLPDSGIKLTEPNRAEGGRSYMAQNGRQLLLTLQGRE